MTQDDWQEYREKQNGIGGSDVSVILGINPYKSRFSLWLEKTGQTKPEKIENEAIEWGNILEPVIRKKFADVTGFKVFKNNFVLAHDEFDWMVANIDGEVIDPFYDGRGILEIKTTNERNKKDWQDGCPIYYMAQVQHYLAVTGYEYAYIAVLIGGSTYKHFLIERDEYLIDKIISEEMAFMNEVKKRIPPVIGGSQVEKEWLTETFPNAFDEELTIPPTIEKLAIEYAKLQAEIKEKTKKCDEIKNQIRLEGKEFKTLRGEMVKITMPAITKTLFDSKQFSSDHPELYASYKNKTSSYRGFDVSFLH